MTFYSVSIDNISEAKERINNNVLRTPLVRLNYTVEKCNIYLKLENLQHNGCFKVRGACNAMSQMPKAHLIQNGGVYTASAGNFAQGLARSAGIMGVSCEVLVPDHAPDTKTNAIARLGGVVTRIPYDDWWQTILSHGCHGMNGLFIHPVCNKQVIAGNGTIGLEIIEDLPEVDTVVVPYGGGGLITGIASAFKALKPNVRILACEVLNAAPLSAALEKGKPVTIPDYKPTFVDGIGSQSVLEEMWPTVRELVDGSLVVDTKSVAEAVKLLVERNCVVAEGAGAAPVAAALQGLAGIGNIVCVISGGNINVKTLINILNDDIC